MATVIKTADGVYQATLTDKETRALARLAQEAPAVPSAKKMETWMTAWLAAQVEAWMPLAVAYGNDGMRSLNDRVILGATVNAVQTLDQEITDLKARIAVLEAEKRAA